MQRFGCKPRFHGIRIQYGNIAPERRHLANTDHENHNSDGDTSRANAKDTVGVEGSRLGMRPPLSAAQLQNTLNAIPAYAWYALPTGALTFVNGRTADYLGLPNDHPIRLGIDTGGDWDTHIALIHPDDREGSRKSWLRCLETLSAGEFCFRVPNSYGEYRWFITRAEPLRSSDGTLLYWVGINLDVTEQRHAESAARKQEDELWQSLDQAPLLVAVFGPDHERVCANRTSLEYLGATLDEWRNGQNVPEIHPEDRERLQNAWARAIADAGASELDFDVRIRRHDGRYRWFTCRGSAAHDDDGRVRRWYTVSTDIDDRKQAEFYYLEAQRLASTGSWAFDAAGFQYWSDQLFSIHGLEPNGKPPSIPEYMDLVHPDDRNFVATEIRTMLAEHKGFDFTKRIVRPDGGIRYVRCVGVPTANGLVGTGIDVTDQELLAIARREQENELRGVLEATPQIMAVYGSQRERLYVNRMALEYTGATFEECIANRPGTEIHPDDWEGFRARWERAVTEASSGFEIETRLRRHDGAYRWFFVSCRAVRDEGGDVLRWYFACSDIEDRKQAEEKLQYENVALREQINLSHPFEEIIGSSEPLHKVLVEIQKLAVSDSTVLILGETGTGKELIARAIHRHSGRSAGAFIAVNCGTIPPSLIATELFGHEKGAFTGATQRRLGRFEAANGGTIFLDEVGDLPLDAQIALLRVLQEREIERVGNDKPIPVNVRVLAATHHDLQMLVQEGKFRRDLFYRLNVLPVKVPSLQERKEDIPTLARYFIDRFAKKNGKRFRSVDERTIADLQAYEWPGNIRELQNLIERAVTLSETDVFAVDEAWLKREPLEGKRPGAGLGKALLAREKEAIEEALSQSHGRVSGSDGAAAKLGIPTTTLDSKIKRMGIDKYRYKTNIPKS